MSSQPPGGRSLEAGGEAGIQLAIWNVEGMMIPEDDLIHIHDAKTGEWTHIDTKDDE